MPPFNLRSLSPVNFSLNSVEKGFFNLIKVSNWFLSSCPERAPSTNTTECSIAFGKRERQHQDEKRSGRKLSHVYSDFKALNKLILSLLTRGLCCSSLQDLLLSSTHGNVIMICVTALSTNCWASSAGLSLKLIQLLRWLSPLDKWARLRWSQARFGLPEGVDWQIDSWKRELETDLCL